MQAPTSRSSRPRNGSRWARSRASRSAPTGPGKTYWRLCARAWMRDSPDLRGELRSDTGVGAGWRRPPSAVRSFHAPSRPHRRRRAARRRHRPRPPDGGRGRARPDRLPRRAVRRVALAALLQRRRRRPPGRLVHGGARARAGAGPGRGRRRARADRRPRRVYPRAGPAARRGRVRGRRRLAGPRDRHRAARTPVRARDRRGRRDVHRHRAPREPADDPGLPRLRLRRRGRVASGRAVRRAARRARGGGASALRGARRGRRRGRRLPCPATRVGRGHRRLEPRGLGRRRRAAQPARGRLPGPALGRAPARGRRSAAFRPTARSPTSQSPWSWP